METSPRDLYRALLEAYGPQRWWPARSPFEVVVGAYLTQNTAWRNVELAIENLRQAGLLSPRALRNADLPALERLVRPAGYFRQKARRLQRFCDHLLAHHGGDLDRMFARPTHEVRAELLALPGIGPETADAILLYAGGHPVFVVDVYLRRVLGRHGLAPHDAPYERLRESVERAFHREPEAERAGHFNELHALIVEVGKRHCGPAPLCQGCPLTAHLPVDAHGMRQPRPLAHTGGAGRPARTGISRRRTTPRADGIQALGTTLPEERDTMEADQLRLHLEQLRAELGRTSTVSNEQRRTLEDLDRQIRALLEGAGGSPTEREALGGHARSTARSFSEEHPTLARIIENVGDIITRATL